jgi:hypothetical protein
MILAAILVSATRAGAENLDARLRGTYAFTQIHFCATTNVPGEDFIGPNLVVPQSGVTMSTRSNEGFLTFDGHGAGSFDGRTLTMIHNAGPGAPAMTEGPFTCPLTYVVEADGSFTTRVTCVTSAGDPAIAGIALRGQLQDGGRLLIANDTMRNVETVTTPGGVFKRICGRSQTAIRVNDGGRGDSR